MYVLNTVLIRRLLLFQLRVCQYNQFKILVCTRGGTGSGVLESTPAGFCVFLSEPESKICEKPDLDPESLFYFGSSKSLCGHFLRNKKG